MFGTKAVLCEIGTFWYHCVGIPYQFYLVVYIMALILLSFYLVSCSYVFAWIMLPSLRSLSKTMNKFKRNSKDQNQEANQNEIEGGLDVIYFSNKDTKLLLDLLAECSGIGPCLKLLCLLNKSLLENAKCDYMNIFLQDPDSDGKRDVIVEFNDSKAVKDIFCQIPKALCTYSIEITPPVESVRINNSVFSIK